LIEYTSKNQRADTGIPLQHQPVFFVIHLPGHRCIPLAPELLLSLTHMLQLANTASYPNSQKLYSSSHSRNRVFSKVKGTHAKIWEKTRFLPQCYK